MKTMIKHPTRDQGSALVVSILTIAVLATTAAAVLSHVSYKYRNLSQATSWGKAIVSAESGIDFAMQKLTETANDANPLASWSSTDPSTGATLPYSGKCSTGTALTHGGEGGTYMNYYVVVDRPPGLAAGGKTKQYYRIRSTGYSDLSGSAIVSNSKLDTALRKLSLRSDRRTGQALAKPRASRTIEVVAAPVTETAKPNTAAVKWEMDSYKTEVRGYNSADPLYSTNGQWDPTKQIPNNKAGILLATNQWKKDYLKNGSTEKADLKNSMIYGDFAALAGPVKNGGNVQGQTFLDVYTDLIKVLAPTWTTLTDPTITKLEGSPTVAQKTTFANWYAGASATMKAQVIPNKDGMVLYGSGTADSPTVFKVTKVNLDKKDKAVVIANPAGVSESWIEIWSTEEFKIKDGGTLAVENGVHLTVHFQKTFKIKDSKKDNGGAFVESGYAGDLVVRGIELPESDKVTDDDFSPTKTSGKVKIKDSIFTGVVYAPDYDMDLKTRTPAYPSAAQYILGAVTGRKIKFKGDTDFITDKAIAQAGRVIQGYRIASWFEDSE